MFKRKKSVDRRPVCVVWTHETRHGPLIACRQQAICGCVHTCIPEITRVHTQQLARTQTSARQHAQLTHSHTHASMRSHSQAYIPSHVICCCVEIDDRWQEVHSAHAQISVFEHFTLTQRRLRVTYRTAALL